jgi:hypothetical protein
VLSCLSVAPHSRCTHPCACQHSRTQPGSRSHSGRKLSRWSPATVLRGRGRPLPGQQPREAGVSVMHHSMSGLQRAAGRLLRPLSGASIHQPSCPPVDDVPGGFCGTCCLKRARPRTGRAGGGVVSRATRLLRCVAWTCTVSSIVSPYCSRLSILTGSDSLWFLSKPSRAAFRTKPRRLNVGMPLAARNNALYSASARDRWAMSTGAVKSVLSDCFQLKHVQESQLGVQKLSRSEAYRILARIPFCLPVIARKICAGASTCAAKEHCAKRACIEPSS